MSIIDTDLPHREGVPLVVKPKIACKMLARSIRAGDQLITPARRKRIDFSMNRLTEDHGPLIHRYIDRKLAAAGATGVTAVQSTPQQRRRGRLMKHAASVTAGAMCGMMKTVRR